MEELNKIEPKFSQDNMKQIIKCLTVYFCKYLQNKMQKYIISYTFKS